LKRLKAEELPVVVDPSDIEGPSSAAFTAAAAAAGLLKDGMLVRPGIPSFLLNFALGLPNQKTNWYFKIKVAKSRVFVPKRWCLLLSDNVSILILWSILEFLKYFNPKKWRF
jgi:hypothetical protein